MYLCTTDKNESELYQINEKTSHLVEDFSYLIVVGFEDLVSELYVHSLGFGSWLFSSIFDQPFHGVEPSSTGGQRTGDLGENNLPLVWFDISN